MIRFGTLLQSLQIDGTGVCITTIGSRDGLGNSMQKHNSVFSYAIKNPFNLQYKFSPLIVKAHGVNDTFKDIFYDKDEDNMCFGKKIKPENTFELICPYAWGTGGCTVQTVFSPVKNPPPGSLFIVNINGNCCSKEVRFINTRKYFNNR